MKLLNLSIDEGKKILSRQFAKKDFSEEIMNQNYQDLEAGYAYAEKTLSMRVLLNHRLLSGCLK